MKVYETSNIRNLVLLGHAGTGKTTFSEALLFQLGVINRRGSVEEKNTVSDSNEIELERGCSIFSTLMFGEINSTKINFIDTPGYNDYIGEVIASVSVADTCLIFVNAQNGVEMGTENAWHYSSINEKPVVFIISKMDVDQADFDKQVDEIRRTYGKSATIVQYPLQKGGSFDSIIDLISMKMLKYPAGGGIPEIVDIPASEKEKAEKLRMELIETIAESNMELMDNYLENGSLSEEEFKVGFKNAIISRQIFPIFAISAKNNIGTDQIINFAEHYLPAPDEVKPIKTISGDEIKCDITAPASLFVFKLVSEAHLGDMTFFKVMTGKLYPGIDLVNEQKNTTERLNQIFVINGKKRVEVPNLIAGDIGATVKLRITQISDTLHEKGFNVEYPRLKYPNPIVRVGVVPKNKGEEEKVGMGLNNIVSEDPSLRVEHSPELRQIILHGQGELHLTAAKWRLEHRYKVESEFVEPRVPYRETIQKQARGSYRHKKQTGGAGQFAEVHMLIEPWYDGAPLPSELTVRGKDLIELDWGGKLEFVNCIVGGVIDQRFMPAILKGVMEKMTFGPLTGCYVRDIRVAIYDGKMHPVDSNEAAFKTAGMMAFKETFFKADPKILEPIYEIEIKVPEENVGDVMSDIPSRRGLILGIESEGKYQKIKARMPLAELDKYATALRSMTSGRATYTQEFVEYQTVPPNIQIKLIEEYKKRQEEENA